HETHLSALRHPPQAHARIPRPDALRRRPQGSSRAPRQGPDSARRLNGASPRRSRRRGAPLFERILRVGRRLEGSRVQLIVAPAVHVPGTVGYVISAKQLPRAVDRNRLRRVLREALRARRAALFGLDIVLRLRGPCARTDVAAVASEAATLLDR